MNIRYRQSLQRTMIIYFCLIGFASCLVGVEFIADTNSRELRAELSSNFSQLAGQEITPEQAYHPIDVLRNKAVLMVSIVLAVVIIVLSMLIKNITEPLQHMIEVSREIIKGDLSQTVDIRARNELSELGGAINELSSNLQEVLLLSKDICETGDGFIRKVSDVFAEQGLDMDGIAREKESLEGKIRLLKEILEDCRTFRIGG